MKNKKVSPDSEPIRRLPARLFASIRLYMRGKRLNAPKEFHFGKL
jgi:hypothetical protein